MKLTFRIDTLPRETRDAILHYGARRGDVVEIDAADLHKPAPPRCCRCYGAHELARCPIPAGYVATPQSATAGRCGCDGSAG